MEGGHPASTHANWQDVMSTIMPAATRPPPQPTSTAAIAAAQAAAAAAAVAAGPSAAARVVNGSNANSAGTSEDEAYRGAQMRRRKKVLDAHVEKLRETWKHPVNGMEETMVFHRARALIDITNLSQTFICRATGIQNASLSQYLRGIFKGRQDLIEDKLEVFLNDYLEGKYDGQARKGVQGRRRSSAGAETLQHQQQQSQHQPQTQYTSPNGRQHPTPEQAMMVNYQQRVAQTNALLAQQRHAALLRHQQELHTRHQYGQAAAAASGMYGQHAATHAQQQQQQQQLFVQRVAAAAQAASRQYTQQQPQHQQQHQYLTQREYMIRQHMQQYQMAVAARQQAQTQQRTAAAAAAPVAKPKPAAPPLKPLPPTVAVERAFHAYHSSNLDIICTNSEPLLLPIEIDVELAEGEDEGLPRKPVEVVQIGDSTPEKNEPEQSNDPEKVAGKSNDEVRNMEVEKPEEASNQEKLREIRNGAIRGVTQATAKDIGSVNASDNPDSNEKYRLASTENEKAVTLSPDVQDSRLVLAKALVEEIVGNASSSAQREDVVELEGQVKNSGNNDKSLSNSSKLSTPGASNPDDAGNVSMDQKVAEAQIEKEIGNSSNVAVLGSNGSLTDKEAKESENTNRDVAMKDVSEEVLAEGCERPIEKSSEVGNAGTQAQNSRKEVTSAEKSDEVMTDVNGEDVVGKDKNVKPGDGAEKQKGKDPTVNSGSNDATKEVVESSSESADEPKQPPLRKLQFFTQWDVNERRLSPEEVAESLVKMRNCVPALIPKIAAQIRRQLFDVGVSCPVPPMERNKENRRRISIRVQLSEDSDEVIEDTFDWDICMGEYNSPELFAQHLCSDYGVSQYHVPQVAQAIRRQIVLAQAIAYGDEDTREAALARLEPNDPLREQLPVCKTGVKRLTAEEIRALHEKHVMGFVVQPLMRGVEREIDRREEIRVAEEEERQRREKEERKRMEQEEMRKKEAREEEERKRKNYLTGLDVMNAKLGVDLNRYLTLKLGHGTSPSVWVEGIFIRKKRGYPLMPAAVGGEKAEEETQTTPATSTRGRGRGRRGRRSAAQMAADGEERKPASKKRGAKRGRDNASTGGGTATKRRTSKRARK